MNNRELRVIEIERGLTEWAEERAAMRDVPLDVVLRAATKYPVAYMQPESRPIVVPVAGHNPVTLRQIIAAVVITFTILASYGVGERGGSAGWLPKAPTAKPAMVDSR